VSALAIPAGAPLKLRITDAADLEVASTLLQDALVPVGDIAWLRSKRRFVMAVNRFRWESTGDERAGSAERVLAGVGFGEVTAVRMRDVDLARRDVFLSLLAIVLGTHNGTPVIDINFAGSADVRPTIRLAVVRIDGLVEDFGEAWPTVWQPSHAEG